MSPSTAADPGLVDLFAQLRGGVLITLKRDGRPQSSVVGHTFDPATLTARISVTAHRAKTRNLRRDPRASYHVTRPDLYAYAVRVRAVQLRPPTRWLAGRWRCGTLQAVGLRGREAEQAVIAGLLEGVRGFRSGVLVVRGQPGVGKSALLEDAAGRAGGMLVLRAVGVESEAEFAFAGLHQLLRPVLDRFDRIPNHLAVALGRAVGVAPAGPGGLEDRFLVALAVLALMAELAEEAPLVCVIDDAHWLDDASVTALVFVARRLAAERVALVFGARVGEARVFSASGLPELRLEGLDAETAGSLLAARCAAPIPVEVRDRIVEWTGGNPR